MSAPAQAPLNAPPATNPQQLSPLEAGSYHQESPTYGSRVLGLAASLEYNYDVLLNFHGKDTRQGFAGHLYKALEERNFITFFDELEIPKGGQITLELVDAIKTSRIFIPVFSANYADSAFCLEELTKILEFTKGGRGFVLPVFYYVDPCQLRHLTGVYGEAFAKHEERYPAETVEEWKMTLRQVADFHGWHLKKGNTTFEYEWISEIVEKVTRLDRRLHIELKSQVNNVNSLLKFGSDDEVFMTGICGINKIPFATVARGAYQLNPRKFDSLCILPNVKEISNEHGLEHLQEKLISKIVGRKIKIGDVDEGISMIKYVFQEKKVLVVLHNVGKLEELQATVGQTDWFGSGSRVIVTTQEGITLLTSHGVERIYYEHDIVQENKEFGIQGITPALDDSRWSIDFQVRVRVHCSMMFYMMFLMAVVFAVIFAPPFKCCSEKLVLKTGLEGQCLWNHMALPGTT